MLLMIIDGNSIVNRAYYGVHLLSTRDGQPTNAIFGFLNILQKLLSEENPDALCVVFDRSEPTFRHEAFDAYKATRHAMPEDLAAQLEPLHEVLDAMRIPRYAMAGWEADDLMGTISRRFEAEGWDCALVTGDRDTLQLITPHTIVKFVSSRGGRSDWENITQETFRADYGFDPIRMIDLKALMGDSSDNLPGVRGVGEKTARTLVQKYGSLDELYAHFDDPDIKGALRRNLEAGRESAYLTRELAAIRTDAPISVSPADVLRREVDRDALYRIFRRLEFFKLIERWGLTAPEEPSVPSPAEENIESEPEAETVETPARWSELFSRWQAEESVAVLPLPTLDGVAVRGADTLVMIRKDTFSGDFDALLRDLFGGKLHLTAHRVKELTHSLLKRGLPAEGFDFDTALAAYLLSPTDGNYDLCRLGMARFHRSYEEESRYADLAHVSDPEGRETWLSHVSLIAALRRELAPQIQSFELSKVLREIELPLCRVLAEMELTGVCLDLPALRAFGSMLSEQIDLKESHIYEMAGGEFNIKSTKQLGEVLFDRLELPVIKKTKRGYSTDAAVLEKLAPYHPIVNEILDYRQYTKLKSTYVDGLEKALSPDGRIHTVFQNTATATGRLSSTEPNLQNIPVRTPLGAQMRKMFPAEPGNVLVDADYSQIELRLLAHVADDEAMRAGFRTGADIHTMTAAQVMGVPTDQVTKQMRASAKAVNFGIVYGISEFSLSKDLGVTISEAREYMDRYFQTYPGVRRYQRETVERAKADGYVSTLLGRRRWLPELKSSNHNQRAFGERVALNTPIQGTAADIIKLAMLAVRARLRREGLAGKLILQVHDELIVECPSEEGEAVARILEEEMSGVIELSVPLVAQAHIGHTWADAH